jgi:hypothetical protein
VLVRAPKRRQTGSDDGVRRLVVPRTCHNGEGSEWLLVLVIDVREAFD